MLLILFCFAMMHRFVNSSFADKSLTKRWRAFGDSLKKAGEMYIPLNNSLGNINIIVVGKTGAGKSTLINNVFREKVTESGFGQPVTDKIIKIKNENSPLTIYDTPGLELDLTQQKSLLMQLGEIIKNNSESEDMNDHIHCIWYCLNCRTSRFEDTEIKFIKKIANDFHDKIPVVLILTQCYNSIDKEKMMQVIVKEKVNVTIVPVIAEDYDMNINGLNISVHVPSYGLDDLVDKMTICLPDIVQDTFINVQKVSLKHKKHSAHKNIFKAAINSAIIGYNQFPIGKISLLMKTEIKMVEYINNIYFGQDDQNTLMDFINDTILLSLFEQAGKLFNKISDTEKILNQTSDTGNIEHNFIGIVLSNLKGGSLTQAGFFGVITELLGITCIHFAEYKYKNKFAFNSESKQQFENYFFELYNKNIIEIENDPMKMLDDLNTKAMYEFSNIENSEIHLLNQ